MEKKNSSQDLFVDEVMSRVEENFLLEDEFFKMLEGLEEKGYDVESLTEEELNEFFSRLRRGLRNVTGGRVDFTTSKENRMERAQRSIDKRRLERKRANAAKYSAKKSAAQEPATQTTDKRDPATGTTLTKGKARGRRPAPPKPGQMGRPGTRDPATGILRQSTDIVRGARLALAERVFAQILEDDVPKKLRKPKKDPAAEKARLRTIMYGDPKGGTAIRPGQPILKPRR